jgi:hypothetical protein
MGKCQLLLNFCPAKKATSCSSGSLCSQIFVAENLQILVENANLVLYFCHWEKLRKSQYYTL